MTRPLSLRLSMDFLHTWGGVLFGALLFVIFFMGTLSVFDREIDRWMMPEMRFSASSAEVSFEERLLPRLQAVAPRQSSSWYAVYPTSRTPVAHIGWKVPGKDEFAERRIDPRNGQVLPEAGSWGGSGFFYPFHYSLHLSWVDIGIWIVGLAAMAMLALLVSGVIVHRRIFTDFFSLRPKGSRQRALLDLHNVSSILLLPFHFVITLSGLIIFYSIYMQAGIQLLYGGDADRYIDEAHGHFKRAREDHPGALASVDSMIDEARRRWGAGRVGFVAIENPGDRAAIVAIGREPHDRISISEDAVYFEGTTGRLLKEETHSPAHATHAFITGLHMIPFEHWWLRWLYFVMGLASSVMIATGLLLWVNKRVRRHREEGVPGWRVVDATSCAGTLGVIIATAAMLCFNRLLPPEHAALLMGAAGIHFAMMGEHAGVSWSHGVFFGVTAWVQIALAVAIIWRPSRLVFGSVAIVNLAVLGVWVLTRTVGIAIGGDGTPEDWGTTDMVYAVLEGLAVLASIGLLVPRFARRPLSAGVGLAGAAFVAILVAAVVTLVFSPAVVDGAGGTSADGHNHGGGGETATPAAAGGAAAATDGHTHSHTPVSLNGQKITGVKAADIAAEAQPDKPLDAATRATLKAELTAARSIAMKYPTVADATAAGFFLAGGFAPGSGAHYIAPGGGLTPPTGPFDATKVNSLIYAGTNPGSEITGLMYYGMGDEPAEGFAGPNDHWHRHSNVCLGGGANKLEVPFPADADVTKQQCEAAGGGLMKVTGWMVHAWVVPSWESPLGAFSHDNPNVRCGDGTFKTDKAGFCEGV